MPMPRYAAKRDRSEPGIVKVLRMCGFCVELMDTPVDALVSFRGRMWLVEMKTGRKGYGKALNANQQSFADRWKGPPIVVLHDEQEALDWAAEMAKNGKEAA